MTFNQYLVHCTIQMSNHKNWRYGQTLYNELYKIKPDLANKIRCTDYDPFYKDSDIPVFLTFIEEHWND